MKVAMRLPCRQPIFMAIFLLAIGRSFGQPVVPSPDLILLELREQLRQAYGQEIRTFDIALLHFASRNVGGCMVFRMRGDIVLRAPENLRGLNWCILE